MSCFSLSLYLIIRPLSICVCSALPVVESNNDSKTLSVLRDRLWDAGDFFSTGKALRFFPDTNKIGLDREVSCIHYCYPIHISRTTYCAPLYHSYNKRQSGQCIGIDVLEEESIE